MTAEPGRFLLVEMEPGLHPNRISTFYRYVEDFPGMLSITDLSVMSRESLDERLLIPDEDILRSIGYLKERNEAQQPPQPELFG